MKFTYAEYESMLRTLKEDYDFISFSKAKFGKGKMERKILLRHDVDQSIVKTERMGEIEAGLGISSTYFLLFRSPFYNMFSYDEDRIIKKLIEQNHYIGLHFDYTGYTFKNFSQLSHQVMIEAEFIQRYYNVKVDAVSFHRPFDVEHFRKLELGSYPHAYESVFLDEFKYYSDSTGRWRFGTPLESDAYRNRENLQILIHPIWWNENESTPLDSINNFRNDYNNQLEKYLQSELKGFWDSLKKQIQ